MRVTLIRHGEAEDRASRDDDRALTKQGRADARRVGRGLARQGARFGLILCSPLVRAVQTAEAIAAAMDYRRVIMVTRVLIPDGDPHQIVELLRACGDVASVALVAHEPILSAGAAVLLGVRDFPALRKAEAIRIRLTDGVDRPGQLRWRIDPATGIRTAP
jgi:phosphohistidine phosphatase